MSIRVIVPPEPILAPEDVAGTSSGDEEVAALIAAITGEIDGPDGWLGRCLGPQTLELRLSDWCVDHHGEFRHYHHGIRLPYPPLIEVESVKFIDGNGVENLVDEADWDVSGEFLYFKSSWSTPSVGCVPEPIIITYRAGYDDQPVVGGGTGPVPAQAKRAILVSLQYMQAVGAQDMFLQQDFVEGVGRRQYAVTEQAGNIINGACDRLLSGLRKFI